MKDGNFYIRWVLANGWAEAVGLGSTFMLGTQLSQGESDITEPAGVIILAVVAILLGIVLEGIIVGFAQGRVLHRRVPDIRLKTWILATAAGAGLAWMIGMIPSTLMSLSRSADAPPSVEEPGAVIQYLLAVGLGFVAGPILGCVQWVVLRRHIAKSSSWLWANGIAWAAGMPVIFVGMDFVPWNASLPAIAFAIYSTCLLAGLIVGLIHGAFLVRLTRRSILRSTPPEDLRTPVINEVSS